ncbi:dodecin [Candidatus Entotheonella palauensis]|uniref:dodecin n=1 Tax=Candidatus Entotheonella palauensis TaxID=93172 RepID=UPI000B7FAD1D|nr:dodecin [Candidatus Entotheonella palauensis]
MDGRTYKTIELTGVSDTSCDDAANRAIARASRTLDGLRWYKVTDLRGLIRDGEVAEYQVTLQLGFRLRDQDPIET